MTQQNKFSDEIISGILNEILNSKGYAIESRIIVFQSTFFIVEGNYKDLMRFIEISSEPQRISMFVNRDFGENILQHIVRYFINFSVSSMMLVDTTRVFMKNYYEKTSFEKEYEHEIKKMFANDPLHNFIKGFRNFCLHYKKPMSSLRFSIDNSEENQQEMVRFFIEKKYLEEWNQWGKGKQFIDKQSQDIDIEQLARDYFLRIKEFHVWMNIHLEQIHHQELSELESIRDRARRTLKIPKDKVVEE